AVPFEIDVNDDATIKAEAENITVSSTTDFAALVTMHLDLLLNGLAAADFESATLTNNTIMISSSSNTSIYNKILSNLSSCGHGEFSEHRHDGGDNGGQDGGGNH
ncbi:MAG: hypothetical protein JSU01_11615, partial [Bacteroidetes bacterium]|nr:hypothetical protein [Bacteroidota bacterium]